MFNRGSLSSWRAWIEICTGAGMSCRRPSRSPHGERGLKYAVEIQATQAGRSLSSWRAWIEMGSKRVAGCRRHRRSPHGERGLK